MDLNEQDEFEFRLRAEQEAAQAAPDSGKSLEGLAKNAISDVGDIAKGAANQAQTWAPVIGGDVASVLPGLVKQGTQMLSNPEETAKSIAEPVLHPVEYGYQHPVSQALNVAGLAAPAIEPITDTAAQYAGRFGENNELKMLGGRGGQLGQLGPEESRNVARASHDLGLDAMTLGPIGREQEIKSMLGQAGQEIGNIREEASQTPAPAPQSITQRIREELAPEYGPSGVKASENAGLERVLNGIEQMQNPTFSDYAQRATDLNKYASGNKLVQATNAETDVANALSRINDENIAKAAPESAEPYNQYKDTFSTLKEINPLEQKGEVREMSQRGGASMFGAINKAIENAGGFKGMARAGFAAEDALKQVPTAARVGGATSIMNRVTTDPQSFGKFATPLLQAAQSGGSQAVSAMHFILSGQYPEYNSMVMGQGDSDENK